MKRSSLVFALCLSSLTSTAQQPTERWTEAKANTWYDTQPWLVGANYVPSDAINELEMFQAPTFNPALNDHELGLAESIGMNTVRVFLQDQLWTGDPDGFKHRLDHFLGIAAAHHIRPMLVLFDSVGTRTRIWDRSIPRSREYITRDGSRAQAKNGYWMRMLKRN